MVNQLLKSTRVLYFQKHCLRPVIKGFTTMKAKKK